MEEILQEIRDERARQDAKWGSQRHLPPYTWMTILMEEVGESAQAALEEDPNYEVELVQVAAVAVAALESYRLQRDTPPINRNDLLKPPTIASDGTPYEGPRIERPKAMKYVQDGFGEVRSSEQS